MSYKKKTLLQINAVALAILLVLWQIQ